MFAFLEILRITRDLNVEHGLVPDQGTTNLQTAETIQLNLSRSISGSNESIDLFSELEEFINSNGNVALIPPPLSPVDLQGEVNNFHQDSTEQSVELTNLSQAQENRSIQNNSIRENQRQSPRNVFGGQCPVCLIEFSSNEENVEVISPVLSKGDCLHYVHMHCMMQWCIESVRNVRIPRCPTCRGEVFALWLIGEGKILNVVVENNNVDFTEDNPVRRSRTLGNQ